MNGEIRVLDRYTVFIGADIINQLPKLVNLKKYSGAFLITDETIWRNWLEKIDKILPKEYQKIILPAGEQSKNVEYVQKVWHKMFLAGCDRRTLVINLGGGVIGDLGGFAAATYMRGVDFLQIPTTLLAQVDSSVGGKVGINLLGIKNLIGTFQQPIAVIIDISTLSTLPHRELVSGFAEIIKHSLIADKKYFQIVTSKKPEEFSQEELIEIITRSVQIKADIVSQDEKESGLRKLLNFGHTIGHAVEAISQEDDKPLLHGEAISIGMVVEGKISKILGLLSDEGCKILEQSLIKAGLPTALNLPVDDILEKIKFDKKNIKGATKFTLLQNIGKAIINKSVDESIIRKAL
ncbi:3-dehydroquinate synthase [Candidatus Roizmanbacteria bacterium]|nr:3-dehydroquinate synthase [Candidatus Roizmanbacteria bacterium]